MNYFRGRNSVLVGPVYVTGRAPAPAEVPLTIADGFLASEGGITVESGARLTVRHNLKAGLLPGLVAVGTSSPLIVGEGAQLEVEGFVAAQGFIDLREASSIHVVGAVLALAPESSLRLNNARLSIRYEPIVPGTVGFLSFGGRHRVFQLAWHEVR